MGYAQSPERAQGLSRSEKRIVRPEILTVAEEKIRAKNEVPLSPMLFYTQRADIATRRLPIAALAGVQFDTRR